MMEIILAGVVSLVITLAAGKLLIPALIRLKAGQSIKEVGPTWHKGKQGTPTMGGLMFIIGIGIAILILGWKGMLEGNFTHLYVYVFALVFGVIGYIDDYQKVKHHQNSFQLFFYLEQYVVHFHKCTGFYVHYLHNHLFKWLVQK